MNKVLPDYRKSQGIKTRIIKIECVMEINDATFSNYDSLLQELMGYGSAAVTEDFLSDMDYQEAGSILALRAKYN